MFISTVVTFSLALWLVLWALGLSAVVAFLIALAIILPAIAFQVVRGGSGGER